MDDEYDCPANYDVIEINPDEDVSPSDDAVKPLTSYSFDGILEYLQSEWAKMDLARSKWSNEKMDYQMKIGFLQNEVKLQENLKRDLVRRIKMLEYALKQERLKIKCPSPTTSIKDQNSLKLSEILVNDSPDFDVSFYKVNAQTALRRNTPTENPSHDSEKEVMDAIGELDMLVSSHLPENHDDSSNLREIEESPDTSIINKYKELYRMDCTRGKTLGKSKSSHMNEWFKGQLEKDISNKKLSESKNGGFLLCDSTEDEENTEILSKNLNSFSNNPISNSNSLGELVNICVGGKKNIEEKDLKRQKSPPPKIDEVEDSSSKCLPTQPKNHNNLLNTRNYSSSSISSCDSFQSVIEVEPKLSWVNKYSLRNHLDGVRSIMFHPIENLVVSSGEDCIVKIWNLDRTISGRKSKNLDVEPIHSFRGHLYPIISQVIIPSSRPISVPKLIPAPTNNIAKKDSEQAVVDKKYEDRKYYSCSHVIMSGDIDGNLHSWCLPDDINSLELFEPFNNHFIGPNFKMPDAIWSIVELKATNMIASISASGHLSLITRKQITDWIDGHLSNKSSPLDIASKFDFATVCPSIKGKPTSLLEIPNSSAPSLMVGFKTGEFAQIDVSTGHLIRSFKTLGSKTPEMTSTYSSSIVNCMAPISHSGLQFVSGHDDMYLRFWDLNQPNPTTTCLKAHKDAGITTVATNLIENSSQICTGSSDSTIRIFLIENRDCIQEIASHKKKNDEAVHSVAFHPNKMMLASSGADSIARVFIPNNNDLTTANLSFNNNSNKGDEKL